MIPRDYITEWRTEAPWVEDAQVEQDLVISRALVDIFSDPLLQSSLAFRGGTALYKLYLTPAARYSEDIDLVQVEAEAAGPVLDKLHELLDPWLGAPRYKQGHGMVTLNYRFDSEDTPPARLRLKVEINTREHFAVNGFQELPFTVTSRWFNGSCNINTYVLNELLGTKLRALYQRRKGRDLFDLGIALEHDDVDPDKIVETFHAYMKHEGHEVRRKDFQENLEKKMGNKNFRADIGPLLASGVECDFDEMAEHVSESLVSRLSE
ncbi:MAG: nucleotidyl transferase AbiEii/AbiGii toxin family protein [Pseudomonadales bacterium]